jgi:hypothetical protein
MGTRSEIEVRELARRCNDGIEVTLLWNSRTHDVSIVVDDKNHGDSFRSDIGPADALDAFEHPYAYRKELAC